MAEIKLELLDVYQANEVRRLIREKIPQAQIFEGTQDALTGARTPDQHVVIEYHDEQLLEQVLNEYFSAQGQNWRQYQR